MLVCKNVTYRYREGDDPAVFGASFALRPGESTCIMGANGSGKSTLARLLAGLAKPGEGDIKFNGESVAGEDRIHTVGILFQNPDNQMVAMVVDKEVAFALENRGVAPAEMELIVTDTLKRFGIHHLRNRLTTELSGGEKQRVALAAAMVHQPPVMILDEPDAYLDQAGRMILEQELARIHKQSPDVIELRITQHPAVAEQYPRLIVMDRGRIVADGEPSEILGDDDFCRANRLRLFLDEGETLRFPGALVERSQNGPSRPTRVRMESTSFSYGCERILLDGLDFEWNASDTVGLIGPTGSGKSTLGLLLCGLLKPHSGLLAYVNGDGVVMSDSNQPGWVSGVLQLPERQFFLSTCASEIEFGPQNVGRPLNGCELIGYFDLVGLPPERFAERDPFSLSVGEKRRLAFAAVLSMSPSFVVFDEPTAGLDQEGIGRFIGLSRLLKSRGIGQMVISHDGSIIEAVADRILYLRGDGGHVVLPAADLFADNAYADVISSPGSNRIQKS